MTETSKPDSSASVDAANRSEPVASPVDLGPLQALVARLRAPDGCPWDQEQTLDDLRAYLIEEAHEVGAAIVAEDRQALREELGDLLFQVVFIGHLAEEEGSFELADAALDIHRKMVVRHPHVFGPGASEDASEAPLDADDVARAWGRRKAEANPERSALDGVPGSLPALTAAYRLTQKAAGVGFDWPDAGSVLAKVREELTEVEQAMTALAEARAVEDGRTADPSMTTEEPSEVAEAHLAEEVGDLLFAVANLARHLKLDPELALARGNAKFGRRFRALEGVFAQRQIALAGASLEAMDAVWEEVKEMERNSRAKNLDDQQQDPAGVGRKFLPSSGRG